MTNTAWALVVALPLAGCAGPASELLTVVTGYKAFNAQLSSAPTYYAEISEDFKKNDAQLKYLTRGQTCRGLDSPSIRRFTGISLEIIEKKKKRILTVQEYEERKLQVKEASISVLRDYANAMQGFADEAQSYGDAASFVASLSTTSKSLPVVGAQTAVYADAISAIAGGVSSLANNVASANIRATARELQPQIERIVTQLKKDYKLINDEAQIFIGAWQTCVEYKFKVMRERRDPGFAPSSIVEIDAAYGAYLDKRRAYFSTIPSVDDELDAIVKANKILATENLKSVGQGAADLAVTGNKVYDAVQKAKAAGS